MVLWVRVHRIVNHPLRPQAHCDINWAEQVRGNVTVTAVKYWTFFESRSTTAPKDRTTCLRLCAPVSAPTFYDPRRSYDFSDPPEPPVCVTLKRTIHLCARDPWRTRWQVLSDFLSRGLINFKPIAPQASSCNFCLVHFVTLFLNMYFVINV